MSGQNQVINRYTYTNGSERPYPESDLIFYSKFQQEFVPKSTLGTGGDGEVCLYEHVVTKSLIAVKIPKDETSQNKEIIEKEAEIFMNLGRHDHIVELIAFTVNHYPSPAMFLEYCDLGDLNTYRKAWCRQEHDKNRPARPSEVSIWKLLRDMSLALDFLHNKHSIQWVHNDFKPANILVCLPDNWSPTDGIPEVPIFKITDLARLTPYDRPDDGTVRSWQGTPEFAPPLHQQNAPVKPAADMWSLGATIQAFALGIFPIQSRGAFGVAMRARGHSYYPGIDDTAEWRQSRWRKLRPTIYRPLDVPGEDLSFYFDLSELPQDYSPYSNMLNDWYQNLWDEDEETRTSSAYLVRNFVPECDEYIRMARGEADPVTVTEDSTMTPITSETIKAIFAQYGAPNDFENMSVTSPQ